MSVGPSIEERVNSAVRELHLLADLITERSGDSHWMPDDVFAVGERLFDIHDRLKPILEAPAPILNWTPTSEPGGAQ